MLRKLLLWLANYLGTLRGDVDSLNESLAKKPDYTVGTWTATIYDYETFRYTIPTPCTYFKIGRMVFMIIPTITFPQAITISQMLQIRGLPNGVTVFGGNVYFAGITGQLGDRTIQANATGVYLRPNWTGTLGTGHILTALLIGITSS